MSSFRRVLLIALRNRANVAACMLTSLVVAVLWAGSFSAVWPIVDVIMHDKSLPQWIDEQVELSNKSVVEADKRLEQLKADPEKNRIEIRTVEYNRLAYQQMAEKFTWISPWAHRWLPNTAYKTLAVVCVAVLISTVVKGLFRILNMVLVARLGHRVGYELRKMFYDHLLELDMTAYSHQGRGDLMNRCTTDLNHMSLGVQTLFGVAVREPLKMITCFLFAAYISWQLLLLTILIVPPAFYLIRTLAKALKRANRRAMEELSSIYETLGETLAGMKLIKAFTTEDYERKRFDNSAHVYYRRQMRIATYNSLVSPITETLGVSMILLAAMAGGYLVLGGHTHLFGSIRISDVPLTNGAMTVFFAMLAGMSDPARRMSNVFNSLQQASAASDRVYQVLDTETKTQDSANPKPLPELTKNLRFENVSFSYIEDKTVLNNIDLEVAAGETIAIVGTNGCGKSTLLQLLPRLYDPTAGRVTIDGVDLRDVKLRDLRSRIGMVSQETLLFNDTVAANIAYGTEATQSQIESAARKAHAHGFITEKLTEGYQTVVGSGGNRLSGGQRQRIALARAILRDPEILILDEATSQIDMESEHLIHQVLADFTEDRTTLIITHRMSTIALADRVVVIDKGQVLDAGSHELLLSRCDLYRRLFHLDYRESA